MIRTLAFSLLLGAASVGAQTFQVPTGEKAAEKDKSAFAVEQRVREKPLRFEQDCPPPETVDVIQGSSWNTVEFGISFPLGEGLGEVKPYTRYTCPAPAIKVRR